MNLQFKQPFEYRQPTRQRQLLGGDKLATAENVTISKVEPSDTAVPPDTSLPVLVRLQAGDSTIPAPPDKGAPDDCSEGRLLRYDVIGANLVVRLSSAASEETQPTCYNFNPSVPFGNPTFPRYYNEELTATTPGEEGPLTITAELVGAESGTVYDSQTVEVNVSDTASPPPQDVGNGLINIDVPEDGDGDDSLDIPGIDFPFVSDLEGSLVVLVLILLLLFIVSANL